MSSEVDSSLARRSDAVDDAGATVQQIVRGPARARGCNTGSDRSTQRSVSEENQNEFHDECDGPPPTCLSPVEKVNSHDKSSGNHGQISSSVARNNIGDGDKSSDATNHGSNSSDPNNNDSQRQHQQQTPVSEERTTYNQQTRKQQQPTQERTAQAAHDMYLMQQFWRTYDTIIILSIFAVFGIMFRMMSATWFRMELGVVFSEDSALGTNLPLNIWSCFLMGLLCTGREAMGIVHSKVLGGANPYGSGRGIVEVGKGAYRGVVDAGKAGINRARGYGNLLSPNRDTRNKNAMSPPSVSERIGEKLPGVLEATPSGLHKRRGNGGTKSNATNDTESVVEVGPLPSPATNNSHSSNQSTGSAESIAGLLGLDDEFRIVGSHQNSEDDIREVQLRGLTRRIMASPSLVIFCARKEDTDVMEHYENDPVPSSPSLSINSENFVIGDLSDDDDVESGDMEMTGGVTSSSGEASGEASGQQVSSHNISPMSPPKTPAKSQPLSVSDHCTDASANICRQLSDPTSAIEEKVDEMIHSVSDHVTTLRRVHFLDGWNVDTSPQKMKHIILLGLRVGFCGALSTFSSLNASVIRLLRTGAIGEALVGYALSIQLGIVSYRFGQHLAVYIFVWRCRRETKRDEKRGYGLRLRGLDTDQDQIYPDPDGSPRRPCIPSVRTIATLSFIAMIVSLCLAIYFSTQHTGYWCSLLFTPFGCLARFALMNKYNKKIPGFPLGTFACNLLSCALSGSLGSFLAGNPGPEESILLTSMIAGFAGSLSTFATFIVEILSLVDPIIFKFDGIIYCAITILWAVIIGYVGSQAKNWADEI